MKADSSSELDIATGELLFEWSSLDHVQPDGKFRRVPSDEPRADILQRPSFPSTLAKLALATTLPTPGTTSTSTR